MSDYFRPIPCDHGRWRLAGGWVRFSQLELLARGQPLPADLAGIDPGAFTPTFVVVDQGREIGRIRGYPGDAFFFGLLGRIMNATSGAPARS